MKSMKIISIIEILITDLKEKKEKLLTTKLCYLNDVSFHFKMENLYFPDTISLIQNKITS